MEEKRSSRSNSGANWSKSRAEISGWAVHTRGVSKVFPLHEHSPLDGLLEVCDQLRELQDLTSRGARPTDESIHRARREVAALGEQVFPRLPGIRKDPTAASLDSSSLLILALLFHRRISGVTEALSGAGLCGLLLRAGLPRSETMELLGPEGLLRGGDWVVCEATRVGYDPLDSYFMPSPTALNLFWPTQAPGESESSGHEPVAEVKEGDSAEASETRTPVAPFHDESDYLWEIGNWRQICMQRTEALFEADLMTTANTPRLQGLRELAHAKWIEIRRRLAATPGGREFGLERLAANYRLGPDHILLVAHCLFAEVLDHELYLSPGECLRLTAEHRDDLFRKRRLVSPQGKLRREGILLSEGEESAKMLALPLCLADWVTERVISGVGRSLKWNQQELEDFLRGDNER